MKKFILSLFSTRKKLLEAEADRDFYKEELRKAEDENSRQGLELLESHTENRRLLTQLRKAELANQERKNHMQDIRHHGSRIRQPRVTGKNDS